MSKDNTIHLGYYKGRAGDMARRHDPQFVTAEDFVCDPSEYIAVVAPHKPIWVFDGNGFVRLRLDCEDAPPVPWASPWFS